jgi:hypothetical protein
MADQQPSSQSESPQPSSSGYNLEGVVDEEVPGPSGENWGDSRGDL